IQVGQWALTGTGWLEVVGLRQDERQLFLRKRARLSANPQDRERFAPIALSGEEPIAQFVIDGPGSLALLRQPFGNFWNCFRRSETIDRKAAVAGRRIHDSAAIRVGEGRLLHISA